MKLEWKTRTDLIHAALALLGDGPGGQLLHDAAVAEQVIVACDEERITAQELLLARRREKRPPNKVFP